MENISPLSSEMRRPSAISASRKRLSSGKIVMISSHPGWPVRHELRGGEGEINADTVHLTRVFHEVLERVRRGPVLNVDDESVTTVQMMDEIWQRFTLENGPIRLSQMLRHGQSERTVICTFLALLELVRLDAILLRQDRNFADILVKKNSASRS